MTRDGTRLPRPNPHEFKETEILGDFVLQGKVGRVAQQGAKLEHSEMQPSSQCPCTMRSSEGSSEVPNLSATCLGFTVPLPSLAQGQDAQSLCKQLLTFRESAESLACTTFPCDAFCQILFAI